MNKGGELGTIFLAVIFGLGVLVGLAVEKPAYVGLLLLVPAAVWLGREIRRLVQEAESRHWSATQGWIVSAEVWRYRTTRYGTIFAPRLRYRYRVGEASYESDPVVVGPTGRPEEIVRDYPKGKPMTVYYDPHNPARSTLRPGNRPSSYLSLLGPALALLVSAAMIALQFRWGW